MFYVELGSVIVKLARKLNIVSNMRVRVYGQLLLYVYIVPALAERCRN